MINYIKQTVERRHQIDLYASIIIITNVCFLSSFWFTYFSQSLISTHFPTGQRSYMKNWLHSVCTSLHIANIFYNTGNADVFWKPPATVPILIVARIQPRRRSADPISKPEMISRNNLINLSLGVFLLTPSHSLLYRSAVEVSDYLASQAVTTTKSVIDADCKWDADKLDTPGSSKNLSIFKRDETAVPARTCLVRL